MALSVSSVFEVRTAGNDTNGGGFVTGAAGTDYSQQDSKNTVGADISTTDAVAAGTTTITSITANFGTTIVGNIIYLQGGTGTLAAGWYQVTARASTTSITVDRSVAAGTGITLNIGGALASLGMAGGVGLVSGNIIYVKAGTYTVTSASTNIAAGCFSSSTAILVVQGYQTARGDLGTAPLLQASGISTFTLINSTGTDATLQNVDIDGATLTASRGIAWRGTVYKCRGLNCTNSAFVENTGSIFSNCLATGCTTASPFLSGVFINCIAHDNTVTAFTLSTGRVAIRCIADTNTGASSDGFDMSTTTSAAIINCVAYNNGRDGVRIADDDMLIQNVIAETNAGFGINNTNQDGVLLLNNATFNNTSGGINVGTGKGTLNIGAVAGAGSFFTNAAGQDFSLNNTGGAGAAARAAGFPGVLAVGGTGFLDIGVLQHADPAASGGGMRLAGVGGLAVG